MGAALKPIHVDYRSPPAPDGGVAPGALLATGLAPGVGHTCVLLSNGQITCWGVNSDGEHGAGDTANRGWWHANTTPFVPVLLGAGRSATSVIAGNRLTCAILDNGQIKCWGLNDVGQLGLGEIVNRGGTPQSMGDGLPFVDLGAGRAAIAVALGAAHTCALLDNHQVKCWGSNTYGQLGTGDTVNRGDGPGEMGDTLPVVSLGAGRSATAVVAGQSHTCALLDNAQIKCWGGNTNGQLGLGDTAARGDGPGEMGDALPAVALGTGRTAKAIAATNLHTCALFDNGQVKCWGDNTNGQLGLGDAAARGDHPGEMGDDLPVIALGTTRTVKAVAAGGGHTCALLDNGQLKCFGLNGAGQLGLGDAFNRGDGPDEMGDDLPAIILW